MEAAKQYGAFVAAGLSALGGLALVASGQSPYAIMAWLLAAVLAALGVVLWNPRWGLLAASAVGLGASLYLFSRKLDPSGSSICSVSATIDCDVVNGSAASELFGLPIALLGAGFFLGVAIAALMSSGRASRLFQTTGLLAAIGCVYAVYLAIESSRIGAVCPMCMAIYASTALLFVSSVLGLRQEGTGLFDSLDQVPRSSALLTEGLTLLVVVLLGQTLYKNVDRRSSPDKVLDALAAREPTPAPTTGGEPTAAPPPNPTDAIAQQLAGTYVVPRGAVVLEGDEPVLGNPNAPYLVVEYACFGCPHCALASRELHQLVAQEPDIQVRFRSFPLSKECNPTAMRGGHPEVCRAAMAAQCANRQGKFWDYSGLVFANQQHLGDELLAAAANQVGLDFAQFSACMSDPGILQEVEEDAAAGTSLQLMGTPSMFLRGTHGTDWAEACHGVPGVLAMVQAHKAGIPMPPPSPGMCALE